MLAAVRNIDRKMIMHFKNKLYRAVAFPNDLASRPGVTSADREEERVARRFRDIPINLRRMRWSHHLERTWAIRNTYRILISKFEGNMAPRRPGH